MGRAKNSEFGTGIFVLIAFILLALGTMNCIFLPFAHVGKNVFLLIFSSAVIH